MNVAEFQKLLGELGRLLTAGGAKKAEEDLREVAEALAPFGEYTIKKFSDVLRKAAAPDREPPTAPKSAKPSPKSPRPAPVDAERVQGEVKRVYDRAGDPEVTIEQVEAALAPLAGVKKPDLQKIATAVDIQWASKTTAVQLIKEIRRQVLARKSHAQRSRLLDPAGGHEPVPAPPPSGIEQVLTPPIAPTEVVSVPGETGFTTADGAG